MKQLKLLNIISKICLGGIIALLLCHMHINETFCMDVMSLPGDDIASEIISDGIGGAIINIDNDENYDKMEIYVGEVVIKSVLRPSGSFTILKEDIMHGWGERTKCNSDHQAEITAKLYLKDEIIVLSNEVMSLPVYCFQIDKEDISVSSEITTQKYYFYENSRVSIYHRESNYNSISLETLEGPSEIQYDDSHREISLEHISCDVRVKMKINRYSLKYFHNNQEVSSPFEFRLDRSSYKYSVKLYDGEKEASNYNIIVIPKFPNYGEDFLTIEDNLVTVNANRYTGPIFCSVNAMVQERTVASGDISFLPIIPEIKNIQILYNDEDVSNNRHNPIFVESNNIKYTFKYKLFDNEGNDITGLALITYKTNGMIEAIFNKDTFDIYTSSAALNSKIIISSPNEASGVSTTLYLKSSIIGKIEASSLTQKTNKPINIHVNSNLSSSGYLKCKWYIDDIFYEETAELVYYFENEGTHNVRAECDINDVHFSDNINVQIDDTYEEGLPISIPDVIAITEARSLSDEMGIVESRNVAIPTSTSEEVFEEWKSEYDDIKLGLIGSRYLEEEIADWMFYGHTIGKRVLSGIRKVGDFNSENNTVDLHFYCSSLSSENDNESYFYVQDFSGNKSNLAKIKVFPMPSITSIDNKDGKHLLNVFLPEYVGTDITHNMKTEGFILNIYAEKTNGDCECIVKTDVYLGVGNQTIDLGELRNIISESSIADDYMKLSYTITPVGRENGTGELISAKETRKNEVVDLESERSQSQNIYKLNLSADPGIKLKAASCLWGYYNDTVFVEAEGPVSYWTKNGVKIDMSDDKYTYLHHFSENIKDNIIGAKSVRKNANEFFVIFDSNGGTSCSYISVEYGKPYGYLPIPKRDNYEFLGWYTLSGEKITESTVYNIPEDQTLYARWKYIQSVDVPVFSVASGTAVDKGTIITLSTMTENARIYYTLSSKKMTVLNMSEYKDGICITEPVTIQAYATKEGYRDSEIVEASYSVIFPEEDWGDIEKEDRNKFVTPSDVPNGIWIKGIEDVLYTGKAITFPNMRVYDNRKLLCEKKDYDVKYSDNTKVGVASLAILGKGDYDSNIVRKFNILPLDISLAQADDIYLEYNGLLQKGRTIVTYTINGKSTPLKPGVDFDFAYPSSDPNRVEYDSLAYTASGEYTVTIVGKGAFVNSQKAIKEIISNKKRIDLLKRDSIPKQKYTGLPIIPDVNIYDGQKKLVKNEDYTIDYKDNVAAGTGYVLISGINSYFGRCAIPFTIIGEDIRKADIQIQKSYVYTGKNIIPSSLPGFKIKVKTLTEEIILTEGQDYLIEYNKNFSVGTGTIIITGINMYSGVVRKSFRIVPYIFNSKEKRISINDIENVTYEKGGSKPSIKVFDTESQKELLIGKDYILKYQNNTNVIGEKNTKMPCIIVTGKGNYKGTLKKEFLIEKTDIKKVTAEALDIMFKNKTNNYRTKITFTDLNGKRLSPGIDYDKNIKYEYAERTRILDRATGEIRIREAGSKIEENDIIQAGTKLRASVSAINNYFGTVEVYYRVVVSDISRAKVIIDNQVYSGNPISISKNDIKVIIGNIQVPKDCYDIVGYRNNISVGRATIIIKGSGYYGGTKNASFQIIRKKITEPVPPDVVPPDIIPPSSGPLPDSGPWIYQGVLFTANQVAHFHALWDYTGDAAEIVSHHSAGELLTICEVDGIY